MKPPTRRELFFQNQFAAASSLLFLLSQQVARQLPPGDAKWTILLELEQWFIETRNSLSAELSSDPSGESGFSALGADLSGGKPSSVRMSPGVGWSHPGPANPTGTDTASEGVSEPSSDGGTPFTSP